MHLPFRMDHTACCCGCCIQRQRQRQTRVLIKISPNCFMSQKSPGDCRPHLDNRSQYFYQNSTQMTGTMVMWVAMGGYWNSAMFKEFCLLLCRHSQPAHAPTNPGSSYLNVLTSQHVGSEGATFRAAHNLCCEISVVQNMGYRIIIGHSDHQELCTALAILDLFSICFSIITDLQPLHRIVTTGIPNSTVWPNLT